MERIVWRLPLPPSPPKKNTNKNKFLDLPLDLRGYPQKSNRTGSERVEDSKGEKRNWEGQHRCLRS